MKFFVILIVAAFVISTVAKGDSLYFYSIQETSLSDGGYYLKMAKKIAADNKMAFHKAPFNRSLRSFLEDKQGCIFPIDPILVTKESRDPVIFSVNILEAPLRFFMLEENLERTPGFPKVVAVNRSMLKYLNSDFKKKHKIFQVNSDIQLIDMLAKNRVDAVVALEPDFLNLFKESKYYVVEGIKTKAYGKIIHRIRDVLACKKSVKNSSLINNLNKFLKRLD